MQIFSYIRACSLVAAASLSAMAMQEADYAITAFCTGNDLEPLRVYKDCTQDDLDTLQKDVIARIEKGAPIDPWAYVAIALKHRGPHCPIDAVIQEITKSRADYVEAFLRGDVEKKSTLADGLFPVQFFKQYHPLPYGAAWGYRPTKYSELLDSKDLTEIRAFLKRDMKKNLCTLQAMRMLKAPIHYALINAYILQVKYGNSAWKFIAKAIDARSKLCNALKRDPACAQTFIQKKVLYIDQLIPDDEFIHTISWYHNQPLTMIPIPEMVDIRQIPWYQYQDLLAKTDSKKHPIVRKKIYNELSIAHQLLCNNIVDTIYPPMYKVHHDTIFYTPNY